LQAGGRRFESARLHTVMPRSRPCALMVIRWPQVGLASWNTTKRAANTHWTQDSEERIPIPETTHAGKEAEDAPIRERRVLWRLPVLTVASGVALGLGAEWAGYLPYPWDFIAILGGPWVAAMFLVARFADRTATQIAAATAVPVIGLVANTIYKRIAYGSGSVQLILAEEWLHWALLALFGGVVLGSTAGASRGSSQVAHAALGWGLPVGIVLAEAAAIAVREHGAPAQVAAVDLVLASGLSFMALLRVRPLIFIGTTVLVVGVGMALLPFVRRAFAVGARLLTATLAHVLPRRQREVPRSA
jgi:hypothetical protein